MGLLNATDAAEMAAEACKHSQQRQRSQTRTETGCRLERCESNVSHLLQQWQWGLSGFWASGSAWQAKRSAAHLFPVTMGAPGTISVAITISEASIAIHIEKHHLELHLLVPALREEQVLAHARSQPEKARCKPTTPRWKRSVPRLALGVAAASGLPCAGPAARASVAR